MNSAIERLLSLRVEDVMSRQVITISSNDSMTHAAQTMVDHSISGVPVVDNNRHCIGILTAVDFVKKHGCQCGHRKERVAIELTVGPDPLAKECGGDLVARHMSPRVETVGMRDSLLEAARSMCEHHIHRLPVLDAEDRPVGIVTALDVVAAVVNAVEE